LQLALPQLGNVALLLFFVFLLWSHHRAQLFPGNLHGRCRIYANSLAIPASHLEPWYPNATAPPWVSAGELQGLLPGAESVIQFVPESRHQPLYFEMMQVYFRGESPTGTVPSDPVMEVYVNASLPFPMAPMTQRKTKFQALRVTYRGWRQTSSTSPLHRQRIM